MTPTARNKHETPGRQSRAKLSRALMSADPQTVCSALVSAALHDPDWHWVQAQCVRLSRDGNAEVRSLVATCIGHIARIHGTLDLDVAQETLARLERDSDPTVVGSVEDARDDIAQFVARRWPK